MSEQRIIKFRSWKNTNKKFIHWNLSSPASWIGFARNYCNEEIQQYTGLKDKNGTEIYEGDIINAVDVAAEYKKVVVEWFNGGFILMGHYSEKIIQGDFHSPEFECVIIGNIYESPEPLGEKNEEK